jgi:hypothetical protein
VVRGIQRQAIDVAASQLAGPLDHCQAPEATYDGPDQIRPRLPFVLAFWSIRRGHDMKKALVACLLSVILALPSTAVQAGHYYYGHGGHRSGSSDDLLIAAGIIGGAYLLGSLLTQPTYYGPPVYYRPAPAYVPTCYQDKVWRRLPDGRIQTGVRTRCY